MKPETAAILEKVKINFKNTPDATAKEDFYKMIEALVELFVDEEPRLVDPKMDEEMKGAMFFKALLRIGLAGGEAAAQRKYIPEDEWEEKLPFIGKIKKFMKLEDILTRYAKNVD